MDVVGGDTPHALTRKVVVVTRIRSTLSVMVLLAGPVACGGDDDSVGAEDAGSDSGPPYDVVIDEVSHDTTQEMAVFAPDAEGSWPVVFVYHGAGDTWENVAELSERVAAQGRVVVGVSYRSNDRTAGVRSEIEPDAECAYRYGRSIVADYGGDLDRPVTMVGHSLGAVVTVFHGLGDDLYGPDGTFDQCFTGAPRPDAIVGIAGCYRSGGFRVIDVQNPSARVELIATSDDQYCPLVESEFALEQFTNFADVPYDARLHVMEDANHFSPIFYDKVDDEWLPLPDAPAGLETVRVIVQAGEAGS
jgi:pimeloyl-ACP methyl ester carboxylesterase